MCAAPLPNFGRKSPACFLGRIVDDFAAGIELASGVLAHGLSVLRERARAWIALAGPLSDPGACHCNPQPRIALLTEPTKVVRCTV